MNTAAASIRSKILILRVIDWILLFSVFSAGIYFTLNSEYRLIPALIAVFALMVVNQIGRWIYTKIAVLKVELKNVEREASQ